MYLIYTDETGTNFSPKASPHLLYGGLVVHESKINHLEHQLQIMIAKFLKLTDIKKVELHTSEIFQIIFHKNFKCNKRKNKDQIRCLELQKTLKNVSVDDFIEFTDELIQFLDKMCVPLLVAIINKSDDVHTSHYINKEVSALAYSFKMFLNIVDRFLAKKNEQGLLIADDFSNQISSKIKSLPLYQRIDDKNIKNQKELVFLRVLHESLDWKTNSYKFRSNGIAPMKYEFESKNMFLIDNINYTNSKDSVLNQVTDFLLFIIRKILEYQENDKYKNKHIDKLYKSLESSIRFSESNKSIITCRLSKELDAIYSSGLLLSGIYGNNNPIK